MKHHNELAILQPAERREERERREEPEDRKSLTMRLR